MKCRIWSLLASFLPLVLVAVVWSCSPMSEQVKNPSAGLNGSFEVSENGLPVNWLMYTPNTVKEGDFSIFLDRDIYKEGRQSLKFEVRACSDEGGWHSPGFTNEFFQVGKYKGPAQYQLSFWVRNEEARFSITAGGVEAKGGEMKTLIDSSASISDWQYFEYEIAVPEGRWLRMQLNILAPGDFWIDDVRIKSG